MPLRFLTAAVSPSQFFSVFSAAVFSAAVFSAAVFSAAFAADTAEELHFRANWGLAADGAKLPADLSRAKQLWRTAMLPGNSTPCVCGDRIFLTTWDPEAKKLATVALDSSGATLWKREAPAEEIELFHAVGSPASSSPACNGTQVFSFFGSCGLLCYDLDGNLLWEHKLGPFQDEFGASSSPVLADGLVLLNEDHDTGSFLIAVDQRTGKMAWRTPREDFTRSYSTPVIYRGGGGSAEAIVAGSLQLAGYDLRTGERKWWVNGLSRIVDPTPVVVDDTLYLATWTPGGDASERIAMEPFAEALKLFDKTGDDQIEKSELPQDSPVIPRFYRVDLNQDQKLSQVEWERHARVFERAQNAALAVRLGGRGDLTESSVLWSQSRGLPTVPSSVVYDGLMYMVKDGGIITSLDVRNGEILKQGRARGPGNYYASLIAGDGKVYLASERGVVTVLRAGTDWDVLSSHDFQERIMATPVATAAGRLIVRTDEAVYCFQDE